MGRLDGKVAIVTGGARGQGGAEATLFRSEGAEVVVTDVLRAEGEALAAEIGATFVAHDVRAEEEWAEVVRQALERHGRIDVLVNNAGIFQRAKLLDTDLATYRRIVEHARSEAPDYWAVTLLNTDDVYFGSGYSFLDRIRDIVTALRLARNRLRWV